MLSVVNLDEFILFFQLFCRFDTREEGHRAAGLQSVSLFITKGYNPKERERVGGLVTHIFMVIAATLHKYVTNIS